MLIWECQTKQSKQRDPTPTIDDLVDALNGASTFSKLDLHSGYHQLSLAPGSKCITTFATHEGLRRYARFNFGTNSASGIFQNAISEQIQNITEDINISDDIPGGAQHSITTMLKDLKTVASHSILTNVSSCKKSSLTFFGFVFLASGISPDSERVKAIHEACSPSSASEIRSFFKIW